MIYSTTTSQSFPPLCRVKIFVFQVRIELMFKLIRFKSKLIHNFSYFSSENHYRLAFPIAVSTSSMQFSTLYRFFMKN